jgi:hypothetical protein
VEQLGLGRTVGFHAAVVVQMVAGKIGKHCGGKADAIDARWSSPWLDTSMVTTCAP